MIDKPKKPYCSWCDKDVGDDHWRWRKDDRYTHGGKWTCKVWLTEVNDRYLAKIKSDPDRNERRLQRARDYAKEPERQLYARFKAYGSIDRRRGLHDTLTWGEARPLMEADCYYCGGEGGGLDRMDNALGHSLSNCRSCCFVCNTILSDLPVAVKDILIPGLVQARAEGHLEQWTPPQKRSQDQRSGPVD